MVSFGFQGVSGEFQSLLGGLSRGVLADFESVSRGLRRFHWVSDNFTRSQGYFSGPDWVSWAF